MQEFLAFVIVEFGVQPALPDYREILFAGIPSPAIQRY
jgi:hypothetical protein